MKTIYLLLLTLLVSSSVLAADVKPQVSPLDIVLEVKCYSGWKKVFKGEAVELSGSSDAIHILGVDGKETLVTGATCVIKEKEYKE